MSKKLSDQSDHYVPEPDYNNTSAATFDISEPRDMKLTDMSGSGGSSSSDDTGSKDYPPPYAGMGKEMVLHYSNTPAFNRARKVLLVIFWGSWLVLIGAVIYLTVSHPRCKVKPSIEWWHKASVYQIYPRSFKDSNGDGVGDINGIKEKLNYLREINVDAVWISPFYPSAMRDFGYDVINYTDVDPLYGSMSDLDSLIQEMHKEVDGKDMKLIIDFIPNHTSNDSVWFEWSVLKQKPYDEFYIWRDCGNETHFNPPNNWQTVLGTPAWTYHKDRKQCYLHQYLDSMPDLNYRNNRVKEEIDGVLRFWLDRGVDGIRIDAISRLVEVESLRDDPIANPQANQNDYYSGYLKHTNTRNLPETVDMINRWRVIIDQYSSSTSRSKVMIAEASGAPHVIKIFYGQGVDDGAHFPFNFQLAKINSSCGGDCMAAQVDKWMDNKPDGAPANWVLGNHDKPRIASRVGLNKLDAMNMLLLLLPGVPTTYYGDEIGMQNIDISGIESQDPLGINDKSRSRDPERSPMQWNNNPTSCYGFTSNCNDAWLPVHPNGSGYNVEVEGESATSHLSVYKILSKLRTADTFTFGDFTSHKVTPHIYSFIRSFDGMSSYLIVVNIGDSNVEEDFSAGLPVISATVAAVTGGCVYSLGENVELKKLSLKAGDGVVLEWPYTVEQLV